jgi:hypothetical protein
LEIKEFLNLFVVLLAFFIALNNMTWNFTFCDANYNINLTVAFETKTFCRLAFQTRDINNIEKNGQKCEISAQKRIKLSDSEQRNRR